MNSEYDFNRDVSDKYSLRGRVFSKIRSDILNGRYKEHEELKEIRIGKELGVSRTPVREALRQLELEGLVQIIPNRGAFVTGIQENDVCDIYAIRALLEGLGDCARLWLAELEGRIVAGAITAVWGNTGSLLYSCSDGEGQRQHANELLEYYAQLDALRNRCGRFDFRGVEGRPAEDNPAIGLHRYKQGFGAEFHAWIGQLELVLRPGIARLYRFYTLLQSRGSIPAAPYIVKSAADQAAALRSGRQQSGIC